MVTLFRRARVYYFVLGRANHSLKCKTVIVTVPSFDVIFCVFLYESKKKNSIQLKNTLFAISTVRVYFLTYRICILFILIFAKRDVWKSNRRVSWHDASYSYRNFKYNELHIIMTYLLYTRTRTRDSRCDSRISL